VLAGRCPLAFLADRIVINMSFFFFFGTAIIFRLGTFMSQGIRMGGGRYIYSSRVPLGELPPFT